MSLLLRSSRVLRRVASLNPSATYGSHAPAHADDWKPIGKREVVCYGINGGENYADRQDFPCPAIRFKPVTADIQALREKEKGDWKKLSIAEKKALYRASFCQTFAEMEAPTGEWKSIVGCSLGFVALALWLFMGMKMFVYPPLPESCSVERQQAQLKRIIDMANNPIEGIASKWDYEKNDWKK